PPVVMLMMAWQRARICGRNCMNTSGSALGLPSAGLRACRCSTAAPASAAATDSSMICAGVSGRYGDWLGVWMEPVTAQVTITERATVFPRVQVQKGSGKIPQARMDGIRAGELPFGSSLFRVDQMHADKAYSFGLVGGVPPWNQVSNRR